MFELSHTPEQRPSFSVWGLWGQACRGLSGALPALSHDPTRYRGSVTPHLFCGSLGHRARGEAIVSFALLPQSPGGQGPPPSPLLLSPNVCLSGMPVPRDIRWTLPILWGRAWSPPTGDMEPKQGCCWLFPATPTPVLVWTEPVGQVGMQRWDQTVVPTAHPG